jgi:hypothetical protein
MRPNPDLGRYLQMCNADDQADIEQRWRPLQARWAAIGDATRFFTAVLFLQLPPHQALARLRSMRDRSVVHPGSTVPFVKLSVSDSELEALVRDAWLLLRPDKPPRSTLRIQWLFESFAPMWGAAPQLPAAGLIHGLHRTIAAGAWSVALGPLLAHVTAPAAGPIKALETAADLAAFADTAQDEPEYGDYVSILSLVPRSGGSLEAAVEQLKRSWAEHVHPLVVPPPGDHGGDLPDWPNDVTLYRLWRQYQDAEQAAGRRAKQAAFVREVTAGNLPVQRAAARLCRRPPARLGWMAWHYALPVID